MTRTIVGCVVCVAALLAAGASQAIPPVPAPYLGAQASVRIGSFFEMDPPAGQTFVGVLHAHAGCCNGGPAPVTGLADATDDWGTIRDVAAVSADNYQSPIPTAASVLAATASADNLTVSTGSRLVLSFHVTGTYSYALAEFDLAVNGGNKAINGADCDATASACDATFTYMVPFTPGTPFGLMVNSSLSYQGIGVIGSPESPTSFAWVSDFSHTVQLVSAEVEDDAGSPVEATIESDSGFDYAHPLGGGTSTTTTTTATIPTTTATTSTTLTTTTTTLVPSGCDGVPAAPTFASIDCRLVALLTRLTAESDLGAFRAKLVQNVSKAKDAEEASAGACAASDLKRTSQRLKQSIRDMIEYAHNLQTLRARKKLPRTLRADLLAEGNPITSDTKSLKRTVRCPADAGR